MLDLTNCKNCGAPLDSYKCSYCGTNYKISETDNNITNEVFIMGGVGNAKLLSWKIIKSEVRNN